MWNLDDKSLFRSAALGAMRSNHNITTPDLFLDAAIGQFLVNENSTVAEEIVRFMAFIKDLTFHIDAFDPSELSVSLTAPAGEGSITLGLVASLARFDDKAQPVQAKQDELDVTTANLLASLLSMHRTIQNVAPTMGLATGATKSESAPAEATVEQHTSETIEVGTWKGRTTYKIHAGWFTLYGAPVYPETLKKSGFDSILLLPVGTTQAFVHQITVEVKDGKPKVVKIE